MGEVKLRTIKKIDLVSQVSLQPATLNDLKDFYRKGGKPLISKPVLIGIVQAIIVEEVRFALMETTPSLTDIPGVVAQVGDHTQVEQRFTLDVRYLRNSSAITDAVQIFRFDDVDYGTVTVPLSSVIMPQHIRSGATTAAQSDRHSFIDGIFNKVGGVKGCGINKVTVDAIQQHVTAV